MPVDVPPSGLPVEDCVPELRAALAGSQLIGLVMARYVIRIEPLASADADTVAAAVAPTLQRYLTGDLTPAELAASPPT